MQTVWALIGLLGLAVAACSVPFLLWKRLRRKAGLALCLSLIAAATGIAQFGKLAPSSNTALPTANASVAPPPATEELTSPSDLVRQPALDPVKPRKAGIAKICLLDNDLKLKPSDTIELPATTVFQDNGPNTGDAADPSSWGYEVKEGFKRKAAVITLAPVTLKRGAPCVTAPVKMYVAPLFEEATQAASEGHIFAIDTVIEYPIPAKRPAVEMGKLIDDISVKAILIEDVGDTIAEARNDRSDVERAASCLAGARKLAAHVGGGTGRQTSSIVALGNIAAHEASYGCGNGARPDPSLFLSWDGSAKPPTTTLALIGKAGAFLTGANTAEMTKETQACVAAALKPNSMEGGEREFRGVKIECQAFARDGGGGAVTIYRRFGPYPERPDPTSQAVAATEETSRRFTSEAANKEAQGRASAMAFAEWWEDPAIPKDVKVFAMMSSRIIALEERCPTSKKHSLRIAAWASSAGIEPEDIRSGGRYYRLMAGTLSAMRGDTQKEDVQAACEALRKYD